MTAQHFLIFFWLSQKHCHRYFSRGQYQNIHGLWTFPFWTTCKKVSHSCIDCYIHQSRWFVWWLLPGVLCWVPPQSGSLQMSRASNPELYRCTLVLQYCLYILGNDNSAQKDVKLLAHYTSDDPVAHLGWLPSSFAQSPPQSPWYPVAHFQLIARTELMSTLNIIHEYHISPDQSSILKLPVKPSLQHLSV